MEPLLKEERQQMILEVLQNNKRVTVPELSRQFGISEVTIRRDLHDLAKSGKLQRAHRGAIEVTPAPPEPPVVQRMALEQNQKERIAQTAAALINDGEAVFLGSGSTVTLLARELAHKKHLTVVTNALNIAMELAQVESDHTIVLTGGVLRGTELSVLGHITDLSLQELRFDKVFMGVQALSIDSGWTTDHMPEVSTTRRILEVGRRLIVLADHTKLGKKAPAFITPLKRITTLITDNKADPLFIAAAREMGIEVTIV
jgi:DeoR/GlpR family transcriptional regulator of sugar metabolism